MSLAAWRRQPLAEVHDSFDVLFHAKCRIYICGISFVLNGSHQVLSATLGRPRPSVPS